MLAWALLTLWPSVKYQQLSSEDIEDMRESGTLETLENKIIKQGLDLKGGIYIVLEVDLPTLVTTLAINKDAKFERTVNDVRNILAESPQQKFFTVFNCWNFSMGFYTSIWSTCYNSWGYISSYNSSQY